MVRIFLGVTHKPWFDFLAALEPDEVNFWQPSGAGAFRALQPGDLFLFKLKGKDNAIAGGGVFGHASVAPLSLVWEAFGTKNGVASLAEMRRTIEQLRHAREPLGERADPVVGCRILTEPFFWPRELWIPAPDSFARQTVVGKGYSTDEQDGLRLWNAVQECLVVAPSGPTPELGQRWGAPTLLRRRLGQGAFRITVIDGYARRCAVSGENSISYYKYLKRK